MAPFDAERLGSDESTAYRHPWSGEFCLSFCIVALKACPVCFLPAL